MDDKPAPNLTERQQKWFATVRANLEAKTGRSLDEWAKIARGCPADDHRGRARWLKEQHGLGANHAAQILAAAFPGAMQWDEPAALRAALWKEPEGMAVLARLEAIATATGGVLVTQRKAFTAFSRQVQFAAVRPLKAGGALLALKLPADASPRLQPWPRKEPWSERLVQAVELTDAGAVDEEVADLFARAAQNG